MKNFLNIIVLIGALFFGGQALAYTVSPGTPAFDSGSNVWSIPVVATGEPRALYGFDFNLLYESNVFTFLDTDFGAFTDYLLKASLDTLDGNGMPIVAVTVFDDGLFTALAGGDPITLATVMFSGASDASTTGFGAHDATLAPVPEPGTFLLLGLGLAGVIGFRRKYQRN